MKNLIFLILLSSVLTACGTWQDQYGKPLTKQDEFECKQKCGVYDLKQSPIAAGYCLNDCYVSKGYQVK